VDHECVAKDVNNVRLVRPVDLYVADPGGEQIRPWPPSKLAMKFGPSGAETVMVEL